MADPELSKVPSLFIFALSLQNILGIFWASGKDDWDKYERDTDPATDWGAQDVGKERPTDRRRDSNPAWRDETVWRYRKIVSHINI